MIIHYVKLILILAVISLINVNLLFAYELNYPPQYTPRFKTTCINKENQLLYTDGNGVCPAAWSSFHHEDWVDFRKRDTLGKTLSLPKEGDDISTENNLNDNNEARDNIKLASAINSESSNNSTSTSGILGNRQNSTTDDRAKTQHVSSVSDISDDSCATAYEKYNKLSSQYPYTLPITDDNRIIEVCANDQHFHSNNVDLCRKALDKLNEPKKAWVQNKYPDVYLKAHQCFEKQQEEWKRKLKS